MLVPGVLLGLGCAVCQSVGYVFSRRFVVRHPGSPLRLLVMAHVMMGIVAAAALPFFWPDDMPPLKAFALPFAQMTGCYLLGQFGLLLAMRTVEASRVSPLLGLKILMLAVWTVAFAEAPAPLQWVAVGMSVAAALLLGLVDGRLPIAAVGLILFTCVGYSLSDLGIQATTEHFKHVGVTAPVLVFCLCYTFCGAIGLVLLPWFSSRDAKTWSHAAPFAAAWMVAMVLFFTCIAAVGPLFANILQGTRGVLSVAVGVVIAHIGHVHLEQKLTRGALARRAVAAVLMFAAIALYAYAKAEP